MRRFVPRASLMTAAIAAAVACASSGGAGGGVSLGGETGGRYLVMIPTFEGHPEGDRVAAELRTLVADMERYASINDRDVRSSMERYGVGRLDPLLARQLATQINAQLVTWGTLRAANGGLEADLRVIDTGTGDEIVFENVGGNNYRTVAANLFEQFSTAMQGRLQAVFCNDYVVSEQYERALQACNEALAIVPTNSLAQYGKAQSLLHLNRYEEALAGYNALLERDPTHADALLGAGFAASRLNRSQDASRFYRRYMEVNPGNLQVRMNVAWQVAQETEDYGSAYDLLSPAIAENRQDVDFQKFLFPIATEAGRRAQTAGDQARAREMFNAAIAAYQAGYSNGEAPDANALSQAIAVYTALERPDDAVRLASEATQRFPTNAQVWDQLARVHSQAGRHPQAIEALSRVISIDPNFPDAHIRRGQAHLQSGNRQQALADFQVAAAAGDRDRVATLLYAEGTRIYRANNFAEAASVLATAHDYASGETARGIEFVWGATLAQQALAMQQANLERQDRAANQRALDTARRSLQLLQSSGNPQAAQTITGVQQLITNLEALLQPR